jgi:AcrR family transcriptional regulator
MRNAEKDELKMNARREQMLSEGFRLFSAKGIEPVSMQEVADRCGLGIATLYRYFNTKLLLVIAIGTRKWEEFYQDVEAEYVRRGGKIMNAAEELDFYLSMYILLYREHRDILRFNQDFNAYVLHENASPEQLRDYMRAIRLYVEKFHAVYEKGMRDGSIRTDEPEQTMFNATMHIMLAVCGRFAQGVVYRSGDPEDLTEELMILKRMILNRYLKQ